VWVNGEKKTYYNKMNFRTKNSVAIDSFVVHPFFGGNQVYIVYYYHVEKIKKYKIKRKRGLICNTS
jgi:hypothetical protein